MKLLIELGCEELPALGLTEMAEQFCAGVANAFTKRGIVYGAAKALWTPRRLAVQIDGLPAAQETQNTERRGPALAAGLDASGAPSKAMQRSNAPTSRSGYARRKPRCWPGS